MDIQCTRLKMIFALEDPPNIQIMIKVTAEWFILQLGRTQTKSAVRSYNKQACFQQWAAEYMRCI